MPLVKVMAVHSDLKIHTWEIQDMTVWINSDHNKDINKILLNFTVL